MFYVSLHNENKPLRKIQHAANTSEYKMSRRMKNTFFCWGVSNMFYFVIYSQYSYDIHSDIYSQYNFDIHSDKGPVLQTWINFNPSIDMQSRAQ